MQSSSKLVVDETRTRRLALSVRRA